MPHGALRRPPPAATRRAAPPPHPAEGPPSRPPPRRSSHLSAAASRAATAVGTVGAAHAAPPRRDVRTCSRAPPRAAAPSRTAGREQPTARLGEKSFNVTRRVKKNNLTQRNLQADSTATGNGVPLGAEGHRRHGGAGAGPRCSVPSPAPRAARAARCTAASRHQRQLRSAAQRAEREPSLERLQRVRNERLSLTGTSEEGWNRTYTN